MPDLQDLLVKTSRTFAVSIPLLDEPTRERVGLAYLLFRIADTFEDAAVWSPAERVAALETFSELLADADAAHPARCVEEAARLGARWCESRPSDNAGYLELLTETAFVLERSLALGSDSWAVLERHTRRTALGMAEIVKRSDDEGHLELETLQDLKDYCYVVAGIVGELLTDLFVLEAPVLVDVRPQLDERAATFGEALQLVNILKDSADDHYEGRTFLPSAVDRSEVFALARRDLEVAAEYVRLLERPGVPGGHVRFTALPLRLARATLDEVEARGPGAKVSREQVMHLVSEVQEAVAEGRTAV